MTEIEEIMAMLIHTYCNVWCITPWCYTIIAAKKGVIHERGKVIHETIFKPRAVREACKAGVIVISLKNLFVYLYSFFGSWYRMRTQWIDFKFSPKLPTMPLHKVSLGQRAPIRIRAMTIQSSTIFADSNQSVDDFQNFFG